MKAHGNGEIKTCVRNLLRITRGEVPYERVKGLDPRLTDKPTTTVQPRLKQDARWLLETYEPRTAVESITVSQANGVNGGLVVSAKITGEEDVSNG